MNRPSRQLQIPEGLQEASWLTRGEPSLPDDERLTQRLTHARELDETGVEIGELLASKRLNTPTRGPAGAALSEGPRELLQGESDGQCRLHDLDAPQRLGRVATLTSGPARELREETEPAVVTKRVRTEATPSSDDSDSQAGFHRAHSAIWNAFQGQSFAFPGGRAAPWTCAPNANPGDCPT